MKRPKAEPFVVGRPGVVATALAATAWQQPREDGLREYCVTWRYPDGFTAEVRVWARDHDAAAQQVRERLAGADSPLAAAARARQTDPGLTSGATQD